jgi:hypothetical protein
MELFLHKIIVEKKKRHRERGRERKGKRKGRRGKERGCSIIVFLILFFTKH